MLTTKDMWLRASPDAIHPTANDPAALLASGKERVREISVSLSGQKVLDFGCGIGRVGIPLQDVAAHVTLYDPNPWFVARAVELGARHVTSTLPRETFDVVFCDLLVMHHDWHAGQDMLATLCALTDRHLVVHLPIYEKPTNHGGWTDVTTWSPAMVEDVLTRHGLQIVSMPAPNPGRYDPASPGPRHFDLTTARRG